MATLEIITFQPENFRILLKVNNKIEFISVRCITKKMCFKIIELIRNYSQNKSAYELKKLACGSWSFVYRNPNTKEILGKSNTYVSRSITEEKLKEIETYIRQVNLEKVNLISEFN